MRLILLLTLILLSFNGWCQFTKPIRLESISLKRGRFYYGNMRLTNPHALQIPFVYGGAASKYHYQKFETTKNISSSVLVISSIAFFRPFESTNAVNTNALVIGTGGVMLTRVIINTIAKRHLKSGIEDYNRNVSAGQFMTLQPIHFEHGRFYYGLEQVQNAASVEIPLLVLDDKEIRQRLHRFRSYSAITKPISLVPLIYLLSTQDQNPIITTQYRNEVIYVAVGSLVTHLVIQGLARRQIRKGVDRYNQLIVNR